MPPGMPDTSVKHIRRKLRPCLLELPGEVFDAENCLQLLGAALQNRSELFSGTGLCDVTPRPAGVWLVTRPAGGGGGQRPPP